MNCFQFSLFFNHIFYSVIIAPFQYFRSIDFYKNLSISIYSTYLYLFIFSFLSAVHYALRRIVFFCFRFKNQSIGEVMKSLKTSFETRKVTLILGFVTFHPFDGDVYFSICFFYIYGQSRFLSNSS